MSPGAFNIAQSEWSGALIFLGAEVAVRALQSSKEMQRFGLPF